MKLTHLPISESIGGILIHNIADRTGRKALPKGHQLRAEDLDKLASLGLETVFVGVLETGDLRENQAAERIASAVSGDNISLSAASGGRVNLHSTTRGVFYVHPLLDQVNSFPGITVATIPAHSIVEPRKMVATVKTIGLAIPEETVAGVEAICRETQGILAVRPMRQLKVAVILSGSQEAKDRVERTFISPIQSRVEDLQGVILSLEYVEHESEPIAEAIRRALAGGADCVIIAGETSIMDEGDVTPEGIRLAGGKIETFGAPVEPGNLLLLAYAGQVPIIGAPGCVKSRDTNVVDLILPRLFAGEHLARRDIIALANGGLLL